MNASRATAQVTRMARVRRTLRVAAYAALAGCAVGVVGHAQAPPAAAVAGLGCAEMEGFLTSARIVAQRDLPVGVTIPRRAKLDDGKLQHDAAIQDTDESKPMYQTPRVTELNFRDSWKFNVAGYELAKMLHLNMVPPYVEREVAGRPASVSWWVNDAMMERDRYLKKIPPPNPVSWNSEMYAVRIFHQLIYDTDPNLTNLLITKDWRIWMVDFSRAFRRMKSLQKPKELVQCDRRLLGHLKELTEEALTRRLDRWLMKPEIDGLLARRDLLVRHFEREIATRGEAAVLYDLPRTIEPCGAGLR